MAKAKENTVKEKVSEAPVKDKKLMPTVLSAFDESAWAEKENYILPSIKDEAAAKRIAAEMKEIKTGSARQERLILGRVTF